MITCRGRRGVTSVQPQVRTRPNKAKGTFTHHVGHQWPHDRSPPLFAPCKQSRTPPLDVNQPLFASENQPYVLSADHLEPRRRQLRWPSFVATWAARSLNRGHCRAVPPCHQRPTRWRLSAPVAPRQPGHRALPWFDHYVAWPLQLQGHCDLRSHRGPVGGQRGHRRFATQATRMVTNVVHDDLTPQTSAVAFPDDPHHHVISGARWNRDTAAIVHRVASIQVGSMVASCRHLDPPIVTTKGAAASRRERGHDPLSSAV